MTSAFGLPNDTPAFGYMRLGGFIATIAGVVLYLNDGDPSTATTLFWGGIIVGIIGLTLSWQQHQRRWKGKRQAYVREFGEEAAVAYEARFRDSNPDKS